MCSFGWGWFAWFASWGGWAGLGREGTGRDAELAGGCAVLGDLTGRGGIWDGDGMAADWCYGR